MNKVIVFIVYIVSVLESSATVIHSWEIDITGDRLTESICIEKKGDIYSLTINENNYELNTGPIMPISLSNLDSIEYAYFTDFDRDGKKEMIICGGDPYYNNKSRLLVFEYSNALGIQVKKFHYNELDYFKSIVVYDNIFYIDLEKGYFYAATMKEFSDSAEEEFKYSISKYGWDMDKGQLFLVGQQFVDPRSISGLKDIEWQ